MSICRAALLLLSAGLLLAIPGLAARRAAAADDALLKLYAVNIFRTPRQSWPGYGIYIGDGKILTAAHVVGGLWGRGISVLIAGRELPASMVKEGDFDGVDVSVLSIDSKQLPAFLGLRRLPLCENPPRPGQEVTVAIPEAVAHSHIISPLALPKDVRTRFPTAIADVATTGNSGSGVFDAERQCLLGIMSRKIQVQVMANDYGVARPKMQDLAKYFVPAAQIRLLLPPE